MFKKVLIALIFVFILISGISLPAKANLTSFFSPRIIAMGGAYVAVADDANAVFLNPAGLGAFAGDDLSAAYGSPREDTDQYSLAGSKSLGNIGGIGFGYTSSLVSGIPATIIDNSTNQPVEIGEISFQAGGMAASFGFSINDLFQAGVKGHKLFNEFSSVIDPSSGEVLSPGHKGEGYALDLGCLIGPFNNFSIGILIENLYATNFTWDDGAEETIPAGAILGIAYQPTKGRVLFAADFGNHDIEGGGDIDDFSIGGEIGLIENMKARVGYRLDKTAAEDGYHYVGTTSAGLGINLFENFQFDYAWRKRNDWNFESHYFSMGYRI